MSKSKLNKTFRNQVDESISNQLPAISGSPRANSVMSESPVLVEEQKHQASQKSKLEDEYTEYERQIKTRYSCNSDTKKEIKLKK